jgi:Domain of unknown function (DUF1707)
MDDIRASDSERDAVAEQLREHAAAGRLGMEELEQRLDEALGATTRGDLDAVLADLPARTPRPRRTFPVPGNVALAGAAGAGLVGVAVAGEPWVLWFLFAWPCFFKGRHHPYRRLGAR